MLPLTTAQMSAEQKDLGDRAMGDGVHATVFVKQPTMIQDQSSQTTYHPKNGEDEATTRRNQRLFSSTKRKRSHQDQLANLEPHSLCYTC